MSVQLKTVDSKGRVTLGREFAGRAVRVEKADDEGRVVLTFCRVVPEGEAWLWESRTALASVRRGIEQAAEGRLVDGPDLEAGARLAGQIPDAE